MSPTNPTPESIIERLPLYAQKHHRHERSHAGLDVASDLRLVHEETTS